jgi:hypothetical protein
MKQEDPKMILGIRTTDDEEDPEETDTASRWIPVALKLAMANADEEARVC